MTDVDSQYYLMDDFGKLRFTKPGIQSLKPYFDLAGIDINTIRTIESYQQAREQASPFFMEHLAKRASSWQDTDQFQLLKTAVFGSKEDLEQEIRLFDLKKSIKVIK